MSDGDFVYTGSDNLEVMADAINYNRFLTSCVTSEIRPGRERVLDFGAGRGTYADMLKAVGVVPDVLEPDGDQQHLLAAKGYTVVAPSDVASGERYDVVYSLNVLEHIKNDQQVAELFAGLLTSEGRLVLYVPAFEILFTAMDSKVGHYRRYRRRELERILKNAGLAIVSSKYCDPLGFFATLAYKWFGNDDGGINPQALKLYDRIIFPVSRVLQVVTGPFFGKNVLVIAARQD